MKEKLKALLRDNGYNQNWLADLLGVTYQSISFKMNGKTSFTQCEMRLIMRTFGLTPEQFVDIFFSD